MTILSAEAAEDQPQIDDNLKAQDEVHHRYQFEVKVGLLS